ncbi:DUF3124 domain-containing protein [Flammeovirga yaeyamensis]|uniref:DUF3124 domain-containing protein n=1 Tax=Flammeovirga yaeyamensis TaxID=367791 RepID=A0AAX1N409_9BACT|nr:DUF3124 domain-containing protein [Flammeovirga yaeyamensis]MBB3699664.1 hypothetical protein [Flammeovirga yaeyamensis]NMF36765.1 DUF3124 domain-containing protein [Flammeovirga yaeyamensis]QWG02194.1 DUF3124 domain-containing protein [Flammeovirga yaeyamensis]
MKRLTAVTLALISLCFIGCQQPQQQENNNSIEEIHLETSRKSLHYIDKKDTPELVGKKSFYVSSYSNLYHQSGKSKIYFTVVLSLRNTSPTESLFFTKIDYYDSDGNLLKNYLKKNLEIKPLGSAEYIVEFREKVSGAGANFIVEYGAPHELKNKPIIEAINLGYIGQHGFAFTSSAQEIIQ